MERLTLLIIEGTDRSNRKSIFAARFIEEVAKKIDDIEVLFADPAELEFSLAKSDEKYDVMVAQADAFVIVTPEYNHSFPGTLKTLLDTNFKAYKHKSVALVGVSSGIWGGIRAVQSLLPVTRKLGLYAMSTDMFFPNVSSMFDSEGNCIVEDTESRVNMFIWRTINGT